MPTKKWILPEGIEDILPEQAYWLELKRREVIAYRHKKFWQCMDTMRDKNILLTLLKNKKAPWKKLKKN